MRPVQTFTMPDAFRPSEFRFWTLESGARGSCRAIAERRRMEFGTLACFRHAILTHACVIFPHRGNFSRTISLSRTHCNGLLSTRVCPFDFFRCKQPKKPFLYLTTLRNFVTTHGLTRQRRNQSRRGAPPPRKVALVRQLMLLTAKQL